MLEIQQEIVTSLRGMACHGMTPSQMLREVLQRYNLEEPQSMVLGYYCILAFDLEQYQVGAIFGWCPIPIGSGELSDAQLDHFLGRHIREAAPRWRTLEAAAQE